MSPRRPRRLRPATAYDPSEAVLQAHVLHLAALGGWRAYHTHDSRRSHRGFPDLVLVRPGVPGPQLVFAELKSSTGRATPEQTEWLGDLGQVEECTGGVVLARLWRPQDLDGPITRALTRPAGGPPPGQPPEPAA